MNVKIAHLKTRSTSGSWINYVVFDAKSTNADNDGLLYKLTLAARNSGLQVDQSALAFKLGNNVHFHGDKNLTSFLSENGIPKWTHQLAV